MSEQDNQTTQTEKTEQTVKNVTGYIHYNKDDDLTKIFNVLHKFRTDYGLKYSHNREFIFFSVKSDCLGEFAKVQPFRISHYRSKSTYSCSKEQGEKVLAVRDSFVRASWNDTAGCLEFLSRTIGRVHNYLVSRVFKTAGEEFIREKYHFIKLVNATEEQDVSKEEVKEVKEVKDKKQTKKTSKPKTLRGKKVKQQNVSVSSDGFTKVVRNKAKYNKNKVKVQVVDSTTTNSQTKAPSMTA